MAAPFASTSRSTSLRAAKRPVVGLRQPTPTLSPERMIVNSDATSPPTPSAAGSSIFDMTAREIDTEAHRLTSETRQCIGLNEFARSRPKERGAEPNHVGVTLQGASGSGRRRYDGWRYLANPGAGVHASFQDVMRRPTHLYDHASARANLGGSDPAAVPAYDSSFLWKIDFGLGTGLKDRCPVLL